MRFEEMKCTKQFVTASMCGEFAQHTSCFTTKGKGLLLREHTRCVQEFGILT